MFGCRDPLGHHRASKQEIFSWWYSDILNTTCYRSYERGIMKLASILSCSVFPTRDGNEVCSRSFAFIMLYKMWVSSKPCGIQQVICRSWRRVRAKFVRIIGNQRLLLGREWHGFKTNITLLRGSWISSHGFVDRSRYREIRWTEGIITRDSSRLYAFEMVVYFHRTM